MDGGGGEGGCFSPDSEPCRDPATPRPRDLRLRVRGRRLSPVGSLPLKPPLKRLLTKSVCAGGSSAPSACALPALPPARPPPASGVALQEVTPHTRPRRPAAALRTSPLGPATSRSPSGSPWSAACSSRPWPRSRRTLNRSPGLKRPDHNFRLCCRKWFHGKLPRPSPSATYPHQPQPCYRSRLRRGQRAQTASRHNWSHACPTDVNSVQ